MSFVCYSKNARLVFQLPYDVGQYLRRTYPKLPEDKIQSVLATIVPAPEGTCFLISKDVSIVKSDQMVDLRDVFDKENQKPAKPRPIKKKFMRIYEVSQECSGEATMRVWCTDEDLVQESVEFENDDFDLEYEKLEIREMSHLSAHHVDGVVTDSGFLVPLAEWYDDDGYKLEPSTDPMYKDWESMTPDEQVQFMELHGQIRLGGF